MAIKFDTKAAQKTVEKALGRLNLDGNPRLVRELDHQIYRAAEWSEKLMTGYVARATGLPFKRARRRVYIKLPRYKYRHRKKVDARRWAYEIKTLAGALKVHVGRLPHEFAAGARGRQELQIGQKGGIGGKRYRQAFLLPSGTYRGARFPGPQQGKSGTIRIYQRKRDGTIKAITPPKISIRKVYRNKKSVVARYFLREAGRNILFAYDKVVLRKWSK